VRKGEGEQEKVVVARADIGRRGLCVGGSLCERGWISLRTMDENDDGDDQQGQARPGKERHAGKSCASGWGSIDLRWCSVLLPELVARPRR
jgi:hypothetical protein